MIYIYGFDPELYKCHSCLMAKEFCEQHSLQYTFLSVIEKVEDKLIHKKSVVDELEKKYGDSVSGISLPQIFLNDTYIGGTAMLKKFYQEGKLDAEQTRNF